MEALEVYCFDELAGFLTDQRDAGLAFAYDADWVAAGRPPLSQSLPLAGGYEGDAVRAFFSALLPEGEPRRQLARIEGVSERNDFALLRAIGGDCPGAIALYSPGTRPDAVTQGDDVEWLSDDAVAAVVDELPRRPMLAGPDREIRLSLAGTQDKLPVVVDPSGERIGITSGRTPSTHILKRAIDRLPGTIANEAFCLRFGRELEVPTVEAEPRRAGDASFLLVPRYDREVRGDLVYRLHQEDFCQALGVPPERKYQNEGGPSLADCFDLVSRATSVPAVGRLALLDCVTLNFLVANHDAHGKNFSLLYTPRAVDLAPFYDILSTFVYRRHGLSRKMAMKLGREYRSEYVRARHFEDFFESVGLGPGPSRRRIARIAAEAPRAAHRARDQLAGEGWGNDIVDGIVDLVEVRAAHLAREMRDRRPARSTAKT